MVSASGGGIVQLILSSSLDSHPSKGLNPGIETCLFIGREARLSARFVTLVWMRESCVWSVSLWLHWRAERCSKEREREGEEREKEREGEGGIEGGRKGGKEGGKEGGGRERERERERESRGVFVL